MDNKEEKIKELQENTLKKSEKIVNNYYDSLYVIESGCLQDEGFHGGHNHCHRCALEILYNKKYAMLQCKKYLRSKGMKRDKCLSCCDYAENGHSCKYMSFLLMTDDGQIIAVC